ncbi:MAG: MBOAT family protein [Lachnospiraceae bacterium]|nr:MBOAT family protein [Lachnospiraceae bacterium]
MVFSSLLFLFRFLPCVLVIYFIAPGCFKNTWKNLVLFLASLVFYAWGEPVYIVLMLFSTIVDYVNGGLAGYFINRNKRNAAKFFVFLSAVINLSLLGVFKYAGFVTGIWNDISGMDIKIKELALPIGISFYTFQTMSYTIDIYRGEAKPEKNIINFGAYVAMFPQLIAGPVVRFKDISVMLRERSTSLDNLSYGATRFVAGLGKKVILANQAGEIFKTVTASTAGSLTTLSAWFGLLMFSFQIYFDFSGYSDMAIGLMSVFGFRIPENFNYPYMSKSITEFWRRWHISLGTWFKEYVYIPLGGSRKGLPRTFLNIFTVWFLTGLWHGASLNFIAWGMYFCFFLLIEKLGFLKILGRIPAVFGHIYAIFVVYAGWLLFAWEDITQHRVFIKAMAGMAEAGLNSNGTMYLVVSNIVLLIFLIIGSTNIPARAGAWICNRNETCKGVFQAVFVAVVFIISVSYLVNGTYNPFLYFRF